MSLLEVRGLEVAFENEDGEDLVVVDGVDLSLKPGQTLGLVGESGCGKSVSALSLLRLLPQPTGKILNGSILWKGNDLLNMSTDEIRSIRGKEIGMIFQEPMNALNPAHTIGRQVDEVYITHQGLDRVQARFHTLKMLQKVGIPEPSIRANEYPHQLSGGMRQRVVIAMALACEPRLLIADEPTTALDVTIQAEILALIDRLKRETGTAVMFITHDMAVVAQMADRVVVMYRGRKVEEGPVDQIFQAPQHEYTKALLAAVPRLGDMRGTSYPQPLPLLGSKAQAVEPIIGSDAPLLKVKNLVTRFDVSGGFFRRTVARVHAVEDVSFTLQKGRTLSLVGESGCGKSTVGRSLLRLVEPHSGEVEIDGEILGDMSAADLRRARAKMQMVFQDPFASLNPQMTLMAQVAEPLRSFGTHKGAALQNRVSELFDQVELPRSFLGRYPHELSGGQRQRVAIARALALNPQLIVADEAVSALDVSVQAQVLNLMMGLQANLGLSFLFISHDMAVVERVSHDVAVMYLGRIVEIGPRQKVFETPQHPYTKALMKAVPIADPAKKQLDRDLQFKAIPSPIHALDYIPEPSVYTEITRDHFVLQTHCGY